MKDPVVIAICTYILVAMILSVILFYYLKRGGRLADELRMLRSDYSDVNAERERWKKEASDYKSQAKVWQETAEKTKVGRDEWKVKAESLAPTLQAANNQLKTAEKERDQARSLANDLREYLDRALKIVNEQNEQIQQLTHVEARNHDGTFRVKTKGDRLREMIREAYRDKVMVIDYAGVMTAFIAPPSDIDVQRTSKVNRQYSIDLLPADSKEVPAPTPVKHLREVNEELAKAAEVQPTEAERPDDSHVGEQAQPSDMPQVRDWNVTQAFPRGYAIPEGVEVVCLSDDSFDEYVGKKGIVKYTRCDINGGGTIVFNGETDDFRFYSIELAPLDPRQHPEHPEFGKAEQEGGTPCA